MAAPRNSGKHYVSIVTLRQEYLQISGKDEGLAYEAASFPEI